MGFKTTQAVLDGLFGRELAVERTDAKTGKKSVRRLTAQDMALLLTVAARQYDPYAVPNDADPIWYANEEKVCDFVHFRKSSLYESRNFLVKLGLLRYSRSMRHMDYENPSKARHYSNVYQIDRAKLKSLMEDEPHHADSGLRETDLEVRNTELKVRNTELKVRNTETHTDSKDKTQQTNRQGMSGVDDEYVRRVQNEIAARFGIDASSIMSKVIADAISGKHPDSVFEAIREPQGWVVNAKSPLGALVTVLRKLPKQENDPNFKRQTQPTVSQILDGFPLTIRCLTNDAIKNTGCEEPLFVQRLASLLSRLLGTSEGQSIAVETIHQHMAKEGEDPRTVAKNLLRSLSATAANV